MLSEMCAPRAVLWPLVAVAVGRDPTQAREQPPPERQAHRARQRVVNKVMRLKHCFTLEMLAIHMKTLLADWHQTNPTCAPEAAHTCIEITRIEIIGGALARR